MPQLPIFTNLGEVCISIRKTSVQMTGNDASNIAVEKYNQAVSTVTKRLNNGTVTPNAVAVTNELKNVFRSNIQNAVPGSSVSYGPCQGTVPRTDAKYSRVVIVNK